MNYWRNKVAVVTGGSAGIGAQITVDLAKQGLHVISLARRKDRIEELAKQHPNVSGKIYAQACDVSNEESIVNVFKWIEEKFGKIHIMINNAGLSSHKRLLDLSTSHAEYTRTIDVNFTAVVVCTREAYRLMQKHQEKGHIININSIVGHMTPSEKTLDLNVLSSTKHAVTNLTEMLRLDLATSGDKRIKVTSISPGLVKTETFKASGYSNEQSDETYAKLPHLLASDVSNAVIYSLGLPDHVNVSELILQPVGENFS